MLDVVFAMHFIAEAWRFITPNMMKNCFVNCGCSNDHVNSNDDSAMKVNNDEDDDCHSVQPLMQHMTVPLRSVGLGVST
jgi:hypothetical protein